MPSTAPGRPTLALLLVLAVAALLRFAVLDYGLPEQRLVSDERLSAIRARKLLRHGQTSDWRWPNANTYVTAGALATTRGVGRVVGWEPLANIHPFVVGRGWSALCGLFTVWLVYLLGTRLFDRWTGLAAAAALALTPLHAQLSRLFLTDAPMTLAYTLGLLLATRILARPTPGRFALAGAAIGLATATKYNGVALCFTVVLAGLLAWRGLPRARRLPHLAGRLTLAALVSVAVFFACDPFILLQLQDFFGDLTHGVTLYTSEPEAGPLGWHVLRYVAAVLFADDLAPGLALLALLGCGLLARRMRPAGVLVVVPAVLYLVTYSSTLRFVRMGNFLPVLPHLALAAGVAVVWLSRRLAALPAAARRPATAALVLWLAWAAWPATLQTVGRYGGDTRLVARQWLHDNVPSGAGVAVEHDMVFLSPHRYHTTPRGWAFYHLDLDRLHAEFDYLVATSYQFAWIFGQRHRPGFAARAEVYERLFSEPRFELAARFTPGLRLAGPEIRIYRTLPRRGHAPGDGFTPLDGAFWHNAARHGSHAGDLEFTQPGHRAGGPLMVERPGVYRLELQATSATAQSLELRLGGESRSVPIEGTVEAAIAAELQPGQSWWGVAAGLDLEPGERIELCCLRLALDAPGAPRQCLNRPPRFWGDRPQLVVAQLPIEVCGIRLDSVAVGRCDSATEALCSEGGYPGAGASAPRAQLTRLLAAARLSQRVTADAGGYCGEQRERRLAECEALCDATPEEVLASGCLADLTAFAAARDTFLSPQLEPSPARDKTLCAAARRNGVLPGTGACVPTGRPGSRP